MRDISSSCQRTCGFVCFACRYRRSLPVYESSYFTWRLSPESLPTQSLHPCPYCSQPMSCIGKRLQVPPKHHDKAWDLLFKQWQAPGYRESMCLDAQIVRENRHFETCRIRLKAQAQAQAKFIRTTTGCERCDIVERRLPVYQ